MTQPCRKLTDLKEYAQREEKLRELLLLMQTQRRSLAYEEERAEKKRTETQAEVDCLRHGVFGLFARLGGDFSLRLDAAVSACLEASARYEQVHRTRMELQEEQRGYEQELAQVLPLAEEYRARMEGLFDELRAVDPAFRELEEQYSILQKQCKQLRIALCDCESLGKKAGSTAMDIDKMWEKHGQMRSGSQWNRNSRNRQRRDMRLRDMRESIREEPVMLQMPLLRLQQQFTELGVKDAHRLKRNLDEGKIRELRSLLSEMLENAKQRFSELTAQERELAERMENMAIQFDQKNADSA